MKTKYFLLMIFLVNVLGACTNAESLEDALYFTGTEESPTFKYTIDGPAEIGLTVSASCQVLEEQVVKIKVDPEKLEAYNKQYGKEYKLVGCPVLCSEKRSIKRPCYS